MKWLNKGCLILAGLEMLASVFVDREFKHDLYMQGQLWFIAGLIAYQTAWLQDDESD